MKMNNFMKQINKTAHKIGFKLKKRSPEIFIITGVVGVVTSGVMACKATTKIGEILEGSKEEIDIIHAKAETEERGMPISKKDLTIVYIQTGVKFVKLYAPSVILGTLSLASIITSHNILRKRYLAATATCATISESFKEYRKRVAERFGNDVDDELRYGMKTKTIEVIEKDENGKEKKVKKTVSVADANLKSDYSRYFDSSALGWVDDYDHNIYTLRGYQSYANDRLKANGYLFLNDVYDDLGFPRTKAGQIVGWLYKPGDATYDGDGYVDFGIREVKRELPNGKYDDAIILDFNVDGNILDSI